MALESLKRYAAENIHDQTGKNASLSEEKVYSNIGRSKSNKKDDKPTNDDMKAYYEIKHDNIRKSEKLRAEINKGVKAGESVYSLLLKALDCISRMTGDRSFFTTNKENLQTIYGILGEPEAAEIKKAEAVERLIHLEAAFIIEQEPAERDRIGSAIRAHREKIDGIKGPGF